MGKPAHLFLVSFLYHILLARPICPQDRSAKGIEETLFGISQQEIPQQDLKQDEFECLNLNITCPAGLTPHSCLPVMLWIHGLVYLSHHLSLVLISTLFSVGAIKAQVQDGFMTAESLFAGA